MWNVIFILGILCAKEDNLLWLINSPVVLLLLFLNNPFILILSIRPHKSMCCLHLWIAVFLQDKQFPSEKKKKTKVLSHVWSQYIWWPWIIIYILWIKDCKKIKLSFGHYCTVSWQQEGFGAGLSGAFLWGIFLLLLVEMSKHIPTGWIRKIILCCLLFS